MVVGLVKVEIVVSGGSRGASGRLVRLDSTVVWYVNFCEILALLLRLVSLRLG